MQKILKKVFKVRLNMSKKIKFSFVNEKYNVFLRIKTKNYDSTKLRNANKKEL